MAKPSFRFVERTGSTNADLAALISEGNAPTEGHWLIALRQTAGRGRQGREWFDGRGNFMGSTIVALRDDDPLPASLSFVAALAVHQSVLGAVGNLGKVRLKWPNDVLLNDGKVAGILLQLVGRHVVIGIGVNLSKAPTIGDRKTAAITDVAPKISPEGFAAYLATQMSRMLALWRSEPFADFVHAFLTASIHTLGDPISIHDSDGSVLSGTFAGLEESDGALRLRLADGHERVIRAGDIS